MWDVFSEKDGDRNDVLNACHVMSLLLSLSLLWMMHWRGSRSRHMDVDNVRSVNIDMINRKKRRDVPC